MSHAASILAVALFASWSAFGAGGGSMPSSAPPQMRAPATPQELARSAYEAGVRAVQKGDELLADAARQTEVRKREKLATKANASFTAALRKFKRATELQPSMHEAWNYLGYCHRRLRQYDAALTAYDRALTLEPGYAPALEYRGHAYLGLNRLGDAKDAYLALFAADRKLAASLLVGMQQWLDDQRGGAGVDPDSHESFASWVRERSAIANQTAGLTREGAATAWR